jgi:lysophospholipase L1-like esterase
MNFSACIVATLLAAPAAEPAKNPFIFADGDRVVFLGGTLIEREQKYGYWELALTLLNKAKNVTFRNLGWSGDTVWCESRGSFDGPKAGFDRTMALVKELKPTVIVLCYGQVESFDGPDGVKKFTEGYVKLIDGLAPTKARIVLMTPTPFENVHPITDAEKKNESLKQYVVATQALAEKRKLEVHDFFGPLTTLPTPGRLEARLHRTENGLHLTEVGYYGIGSLIDSKPITSDTALFDGAPALREAIIAKNRLYFDRWRPQNQTYLFGFRKKEQGQNAKEIAEFDPLIEKAEKDIAELRKKLK